MNINISAFEKAFGEPPNAYYRGCWHLEVDGKLRRLWGWWPRIEQYIIEWTEYGLQVRLLGSSVEKVDL